MGNLYKFEYLNFSIYDHGGSRVYLEKDGNRQLICDTYGDKENYDDMELRQAIHKAIRDYFKKNDLTRPVEKRKLHP